MDYCLFTLHSSACCHKEEDITDKTKNDQVHIRLHFFYGKAWIIYLFI